MLSGIPDDMREWRNWQTRTFEGRVVIRTGSSPVSRTKQEMTPKGCHFLFVIKDEGT